VILAGKIVFVKKKKGIRIQAQSFSQSSIWRRKRQTIDRTKKRTLKTEMFPKRLTVDPVDTKKPARSDKAKTEKDKSAPRLAIFLLFKTKFFFFSEIDIVL
jgi:NRPS condensation-like uncharacterized protein